MELQNALSIARTYPYVDIDAEGRTIRKHLNTGELTPELLRSYVVAHQQVTIVPKKLNGNSPIRLIGNAMTVDLGSIQNHQPRGLDGFEPSFPPVAPAPSSRQSGSEDLYRILYENAREEAREYKRKYEDALNDKHKVELELAGNKNSVVGDIAQGLAGFAPMLMGSMGGGVGVAGVPQQQQPQPAPGLKPVSDVKLAAIIQYYNKLDDAGRQKVYELLAKVFADLSKIDQIISTL